MTTATAFQECVVCGLEAGYRVLERGEAIAPFGSRIVVEEGDAVCLRHQARNSRGDYVRVEEIPHERG